METDFEISRYAQDKNPNPHFHESYEILISLNNEGRFFVRERGYSLRFGMVFLLSPFEIHRCFCHGSQNYDRYAIHFSRKLLQDMSTRSTDLVGLFDTAPLFIQVQDDVLAKLMMILSCLMKPADMEYGDDIARSLQFQNFLLSLARFVQRADPDPTPLPECDGRVGEILDYIHLHFAEELTLNSLAREFFLSKSRLSQMFKDATGFAVGDYIITYRIKRACSLLQDGTLVKDTSRAVGFRNSTHFIRTFKQRTGYSPSEFVKQHQKLF